MMIWDSNIFTFSLNGLKLPENLLQPHTMLIKLYLDYQLKMYSDWKALNNSPSWPDSLWNYQLWFVWVNITSSSCIFTFILIKSELNYFKSCTSVMDVKLKISTLQICKATFKTGALSSSSSLHECTFHNEQNISCSYNNNNLSAYFILFLILFVSMESVSNKLCLIRILEGINPTYLLH